MDEAEWAVRPCSETWTICSRPCPWFAYGMRCGRHWVELVTPWEFVVLGVTEAITACALVCLLRILRASRRRGGSWNDFERSVFYCSCAALILLVACVDPNGVARRLPVAVLGVALPGIRFFMDLALIQIMSAYHKVLAAYSNFRISTADDARDRRFEFRGTFAVAVFLAAHHATFYALMTWYAVPKRGRPGCMNRIFELVWHFGAGAVEAATIGMCFRHALRVRAELRHSPHDLTTTNEQVRRSILLRLVGLFVVVVTFFLYVILILVPEIFAEGLYTCLQPTCTVADYARSIWWVISWIVCIWSAVLFFAVNKNHATSPCCCDFARASFDHCIFLASSMVNLGDDETHDDKPGSDLMEVSMVGTPGSSLHPHLDSESMERLNYSLSPNASRDLILALSVDDGSTTLGSQLRPTICDTVT